MNAQLNYAGWLAFGAAAAAGASAAIVGALTAQAVSELPVEDRQYKDSPPAMFRATWLPIRILAHALAPCIPERLRSRLVVKLLNAGLDYALGVEQLLAFQLICAVATALLAWFALATWGIEPAAGVLAAAMGGFALPLFWLRDRISARRRSVQKTLPYALDLITLCVEAGLTLQSALGHAVAKGPSGPLREEMSRVLRDHRAGKTRMEALRHMSVRMNDPSIANLVGALIQSEVLGMNLGPILRAQSEQRRSERFSRAEKLAMEAPVKLLFPLIAFIFPCTFIVLGFPIAVKFLRTGL